jgi:DNA invertase Pin-like site-specific DNA recombinase
MLVGYARVSTVDQSNELQLAAFQRHDVKTVYQERQSSIKKRPVLDDLISTRLKPGDVLCVYKLDRLARSMIQFVRIFEQLKAKQVGFRSLTESIETETPQGRMFLNLLGVFAEFERELIRERCMAGQKAARARGQTWGRKAILTPQQAIEVTALWRSGQYEQKALAKLYGMSESALRDSIHKVERRGRWSKIGC